MSRHTAINHLLWPGLVRPNPAPEAFMAYDPSIDTDDSAIPAAIRHFLRRRLFELSGAVLFLVLVAVGVALATWSVDDPSLNHALDRSAANWLGYPGAVVADELMQFLGLGVLPLVAIPMTWAVRLMSHGGIRPFFRKTLSWFGASLALSAALAALPVPSRWALAAGLGGNAGDVLNNLLLGLLSVGLKGVVAQLASCFMFLGLGLWLARTASSVVVESRQVVRQARQIAGQSGGLMRSLGSGMREIYRRWRERRKLRATEREADREPRGDILTRLAPARPAISAGSKARIEPQLARPRRPVVLPPDEDPEGGEEFADDDVGVPIESGLADEEADDLPVPASSRVTPAAKPIKQGKKVKADAQPSFRFGKKQEFELPSLTLLAEPKRVAKSAEHSEEALEQNARMLEGVLDDFGVKGQIINVHPGPVVTLYELEPAPGIKSSRVISLADDIARSMSAVSARVAVVPGRNAIGIELPNAKRETVYLRELLASEAFEKTSQSLALALGKNIGGEPVFADLARMPHVLIAGTTGSGKSVGINTMVLSLLYRLPPERCRLIMIDPKMLELSVYEGIPHLLSPVVTDPRKAVVALKWAVREMEERYRKMSKVGVRNVDGYNTRILQAKAKGEQVSRTVQTGFDAETGEPIFEHESVELTTMPYIVVIIDEMADLMMVAGKDIEGAVQRLAQMARAAGIHVVMATQRPSVDVITGTIKANFPTRMSFQVTSKIDSRTILGEQGAEQLLGQGDMLYMAGGGRITRLHGPFVSDGEVEKIVNFLKSQGTPQYVDAVTEELDEEALGELGGGAPGEAGGSGDDLYDQAVAVVLRDKKVSTSYVQRRLQIGYNKAASLIERMEKEGLISPANATGKREILVPGDSARD
jgi:S-DNA-T family DNA segregation ATPase FtsK/SpoIIIE